jgi:hypothetical protein
MSSSLGIGLDLGYDILGTVIFGWHARNDVGGVPYGDEEARVGCFGGSRLIYGHKLTSCRDDLEHHMMKIWKMLMARSAVLAVAKRYSSLTMCWKT